MQSPTRNFANLERLHNYRVYCSTDNFVSNDIKEVALPHMRSVARKRRCSIYSCRHPTPAFHKNIHGIKNGHLESYRLPAHAQAHPSSSCLLLGVQAWEPTRPAYIKPNNYGTSGVQVRDHRNEYNDANDKRDGCQ